MGSAEVPAELVEVQSLSGHTDRVWSVAWSPNGNALASCSGDKTVRIWAKDGGIDSAAGWTCKHVLEGSHTKTIRSCEWSPCGRMLATASFDMTTGIWERVGNEFQFVASLEGHENEVKSASWSPSGSFLATCGRDKSVWIWEVGPGHEFDCISVLNGHRQDVKMVCWHPHRDLLVSASYDDTCKVWREDEGGDDWLCAQTLGGHTSTVWAAAFDARGERLVSCSDDLTLKVWDTRGEAGEGEEGGGWKCLSTVDALAERTVFSVDWSGVNGRIATGSGDDSIRVFGEDLASATKESGLGFQLIVEKVAAHAGDVNAVRWHTKLKNILASGGDDCLVKIWELRGDSTENGVAHNENVDEQ